MVLLKEVEFMKRFRRVFALLMVLTMMLGMTIVAEAEESAAKPTITVNGVTAGATFKYEQAIVADRTTETGWALTESARSAFLTGFNVDDEQAAIKAYFADTTTDATRAAVIAEIETSQDFTNGQTVDDPGLYIISVIPVSGDTYIYNKMAAYVGIDYTNGAAVDTTAVTVNAKKVPNKVDKTVSDEYVEINDVVTYTITFEIPYIKSNDEFTVTDTLTGGEYYLNDNDEFIVNTSYVTTDESGDEITVDDEKVVTVTATESGSTFTLDLSDLADGDNSLAGKTLTITYDVVVTSVKVNNTVVPSFAENNPSEKVVYTSPITITKKNESTATSEELLAGAEFVILNADGKYAVLDDENVLTGWDASEENATVLTTVDDGTATAYGFDADKKYEFKEVKAPTGYSLNDINAEVTFEYEDANAASGPQYGYAVMHDTKLTRLPFAGGTGTGIFTTLGILLMSGAGLLYFSTKKNSPK